MTVEQVAEEAVAAEVCGGVRCPMRRTAEHQPLSEGYCENCVAIERRCPSCHEYRPQVGWWYGLRTMSYGGLTAGVGWCCDRCRFPLPDRIVFAQSPDYWGDHPGLRALAVEHPMFVAELELSEVERPALAAKLAEGGDDILARVARRLRDPTFDGRLEVDVAEFPFRWRWSVPGVLQNASVRATDQHSVAAGPLSTLSRLFESWLASLLPEPVEPVSAAEQADREAAARRQGRERKVS